MGAMKEITGGTVLAMPTKDIWFDDSQAANYLSYDSTKYFQTNIMCVMGFPKPRYVHGSRRWNALELSNWLNEQTGEPIKKIGRPRKTAA